MMFSGVCSMSSYLALGSRLKARFASLVFNNALKFSLSSATDFGDSCDIEYVSS